MGVACGDGGVVGGMSTHIRLLMVTQLVCASFNKYALLAFV